MKRMSKHQADISKTVQAYCSQGWINNIGDHTCPDNQESGRMETSSLTTRRLFMTRDAATVVSGDPTRAEEVFQVHTQHRHAR